MTTCVLLIGVISCIVTGPRPSPAEAARILTASVPPYVAPPAWPTEPLVVYSGTGEASLGPWTMPVPAPRVRLDGTPLTQPPSVYGMLDYYPMFDPRFGSRGYDRGYGRGRRR